MGGLVVRMLGGATTAALFLMIITGGAFAQDAEGGARKLLVEALRAWNSPMEEGDYTSRLEKLREAEAALDRIASEYPTTDTGIQVISRATFGEFSAAELERTIEIMEGMVEMQGLEKANVPAGPEASPDEGFSQWSCSFPITDMKELRERPDHGMILAGELEACLDQGLDPMAPMDAGTMIWKAGDPIAYPLALEIFEPEALRLLLESTGDSLSGPIEERGSTLLHFYVSDVSAGNRGSRPAIPVEFIAIAGDVVPVDSHDNEGETPLMRANSGPFATEALDAVLALGPDLNAVNENGETALHIIAGSRDREGTAERVARLLESGADPDIANLKAKTPLIAAIEAGQEDAAVVLLEADAILEPEVDRGLSALHAAIRSDASPELISKLLDAGADPIDASRSGMTLLHRVARAGTPDVAHVLIRAGADPAAQTSKGVTPADYAAENPAFAGSDVLQ
ncbi:ankyrin repeat domain-containing protein [uncultured Jannaschia sp.]|uniref:ankyrin repeat domain-containing protein n=1 Tax=uncultured Jannaschia sp. TaxID=293347 RepID=UPI002614D644|nr:ankyrin repeat domain-containing protein [uncultured Jannaschia sp.]